MTNLDHRLNWSWWALRIGLGVGPIITGIDKYFNKLTDWTMYLSPLVTRLTPVSAATFMHMVGAIEILAGLMSRAVGPSSARRSSRFGFWALPSTC